MLKVYSRTASPLPLLVFSSSTDVMSLKIKAYVELT